MSTVLELADLSVDYRLGDGGFGRSRLRAVEGVSFSIDAGKTFALVGESGSGKSTTAMATVRLLEPVAGRIVLDGDDITHLSQRRLRPTRRKMQVVFQNPYSSLDPSMVIGDIIGEPLEVHDGLKGQERDDRVKELCELVGLSARHLKRYPHEFSGGQRQRVAIARALATNPALLICDEATSALDMSTQSTIINLLEDLQDQLLTAYLVISHSLAVVRHISDRVGVMYLGRLVEEGPVERVFEAPAHPYTAALLSAIPRPHPEHEGVSKRIVLQGEMPDPFNRPSACPFQTRCPYVMDVCREVMPEATPTVGGGFVRCHLQTSGPEQAGDTLSFVGEPRPGTLTRRG